MKTLAILVLLVQAPLPTGPFEVSRTDFRWTDTARDRKIPVHMWYPTPLASRLWPVVVFSPGAGTPASTMPRS